MSEIDKDNDSLSEHETAMELEKESAGTPAGTPAVATGDAEAVATVAPAVATGPPANVPIGSLAEKDGVATRIDGVATADAPPPEAVATVAPAVEKAIATGPPANVPIGSLAEKDGVATRIDGVATADAPPPRDAEAPAVEKAVATGPAEKDGVATRIDGVATADAPPPGDAEAVATVAPAVEKAVATGQPANVPIGSLAEKDGVATRIDGVATADAPPPGDAEADAEAVATVATGPPANVPIGSLAEKDGVATRIDGVATADAPPPGDAEAVATVDVSTGEGEDGATTDAKGEGATSTTGEGADGATSTTGEGADGATLTTGDASSIMTLIESLNANLANIKSINGKEKKIISISYDKYKYKYNKGSEEKTSSNIGITETDLNNYLNDKPDSNYLKKYEPMLIIYNENYKQWINGLAGGGGGNGWLGKYRTDVNNTVLNKKREKIFICGIPTNAVDNELLEVITYFDIIFSNIDKFNTIIFFGDEKDKTQIGNKVFVENDTIIKYLQDTWNILQQKGWIFSNKRTLHEINHVINKLPENFLMEPLINETDFNLTDTNIYENPDLLYLSFKVTNDYEDKNRKYLTINKEYFIRNTTYVNINPVMNCLNLRIFEYKSKRMMFVRLYHPKIKIYISIEALNAINNYIDYGFIIKTDDNNKIYILYDGQYYIDYNKGKEQLYNDYNLYKDISVNDYENDKEDRFIINNYKLTNIYEIYTKYNINVKGELVAGGQIINDDVIDDSINNINDDEDDEYFNHQLSEGINNIRLFKQLFI